MVALPASLHPLLVQIKQTNENEVDPVETSTKPLKATKTQAKEVDPEDMEAGLLTRIHAQLEHHSTPIDHHSSSGPRLLGVTSKTLPLKAHSREETRLVSDPEQPDSSVALLCTFTR